jgi:hypothetical protein
VQIAAALGARVIAVSEDKLAMARHEGAEATVTAGPDAPAHILEITEGGAAVTVDALGSNETTLSAVRALGKYGRHLQVGLTGPQDAGVMPIPMDVVVFNELRIVGSLGCPIASYSGMLSMVAAGKLQPRRLVEKVVSVHEAGALLENMTNYNTLGFTVINNWAEGAAGRARSDVAKAIRRGVTDRALGSVGLFLIALVGLATGWGRLGRAVILVRGCYRLGRRSGVDHAFGALAGSGPATGPAGAVSGITCGTGLTFQATGRALYVTAGPLWKIRRDKRFPPSPRRWPGSCPPDRRS